MNQKERDCFTAVNRVNTALYKSVFTSERDEYHPWDVETWSASTEYGAVPVAIEIKIRVEGITYFQKYAPFLERKKLRGMLKKQQEILRRKGITVRLFYLNVTADRVAQLFELKAEEAYRWEWRRLPKSQEDRTKVWKEVALLSGTPYQTFFI